MSIKKYVIKNKVWLFSWYKWLFFGLTFCLLSCLFFKCCNVKSSIVNGGDSSVDLVVETPFKSEFLPDYPNRLLKIDTSKIRTYPDDPIQREIVSDLINVYLFDTIDISVFVDQLVKNHPQNKIEVTYYAEEYKRIQLRVNESDRKSYISLLKKDYPKTVKFIVDEWIIRTSKSAPNDPGYKDESDYWFYEMIGVISAWEDGFGDSEIIVAVIDDSFDLDHLELKGQNYKAWNVFEYSDHVYSSGKEMIHGTHVAGLVAGNANNEFGMSGVAPGCKIMPIQISDASGVITTSSLLDGVFYALKNDAKVINLSLALSLSALSGSNYEDQVKLSHNFLMDEAKMWEEIYSIAEKEGVTIVQAAGNNSVIASIDPMKRSKSTIIVGSISSTGQVSSFSNVGENVCVYAPGERIVSSLPNNKFGPLDGTSMSSPIVAGCVALIKSKAPDLTTEEIKGLIKETGQKIFGQSGVLIQINKILEKV